MRRWMILIVVALLAMPSAVMAQSNLQSFDSALNEIDVSWVSWADKNYTLAGISFTEPLAFSFIGIDLETEKDASAVIEKLPAVFERMMSESYGEGPIPFARVSAGQVGDERYAASAKVDAEDVEATLGYVMASQDNFVVVGFTFGLITAPVRDVAPFVENTLDRIIDVQPTSREELRMSLPQLDDMPAGYADDDDPGVAPTPRPTPFVTPTPTITTIHLFGNGTYQASRLRLSADTYKITFTCSSETGTATVTWGTQDAPLSLVTSRDHQDLRLYTLDALAVASVSIECSGMWVLNIEPN